jgi:maltose/moltooligosaccharide transporter
MWFGLFSLMFLDTSINMAMQPFKMLVGDMVNEPQKVKAYSIQSFLCNAGGIVGFVFPFLFTAIGIANTAATGVVPDSVIYSFYIGAAILILCVIYTTVKVKEWTPEDYAEYNGTTAQKEESANWFVLLKKAPAAFWQVGLVQFFCWAAFLYMWNYTTGAISDTVWGTTEVSSAGYQEAGNWTGIVFAVQTLGAVLWAMVLPQFRKVKMAYALSLVMGGIGFAMVPFVHDPYLLFVPFALIGCAWAAMLAMPFAMVTNALQGYGHMGAYLGLFNCTICIPQIVAALLGGVVLSLVGSHQYNMMVVAGVCLFIGAVCVFGIRSRRRG